MPFCAQCGVQITDDQHFCSNCGERIGSAAIAQQTPSPPVTTTVTNPQAGKMLMLTGGIGMLAGCMATVGGIGAQSGGTRGFGILMFFVGLVVFLAGKLNHWWQWK